MVNQMLQVEKTGKLLLRIAMAFYLLSVASMSFQLSSGLFWILSLLMIVVPILLLLHFKIPKIGLIGGFAAMLFFFFSALFIVISDIQTNTPWQLIYLHAVKDILLLFAAVVLAGESLKEVVRQKLIQPFPRA
jgi:uncharacterized membrane protein YkgB